VLTSSSEVEAAAEYLGGECDYEYLMDAKYDENMLKHACAWAASIRSPSQKTPFSEKPFYCLTGITLT